VQLYHLPSDPREENDVAAAHPELVAEMVRRMAAARVEHVDFPLHVEEPPGLLGVGANLGPPSVKSSNTCFADLARSALPWRARATREVVIALDTAGYPAELPEGGVYSLAVNRWHPPGDYVLTWAGEGDVRLDAGGTDGAAELIEDAPGRRVYRVRPSSYQSIVILTQKPGDRVRDVHLWLPGTEELDPPFNPAWLAIAARAEPLRFSGLLGGAPGEAARYSFAGGATGLPSEWIGALVAATGRTPWVTVPTAADEAAVRALASAVIASLPEGKRCYVESGQGGRDGGLARAAQVAAWWREESGRAGGGRGVRAVLARPLETEADLDALRAELGGVAAASFDVLAIAPHAGIGLAARLERPLAAADADAVFDALFADQSERVRSQIARARALADEHGWTLAAYAGGQHVSAFRGELGPDEHDVFARLIAETARHPRMETFYRRMLGDWRELAGDGPFVHTDLVANIHHVAHWGLKETLDQPDAHAPKLRALRPAISATPESLP
jgi:hypothetical protein